MAIAAPDRLHYTDSDEANQLIATDPLALLIGFALDQQVPVQTAFAGPLKIKQRLGTRKASFASPDETRELTGMAIGGVTAFGLFLTPLFYVLLRTLAVRLDRGRPKRAVLKIPEAA